MEPPGRPCCSPSRGEVGEPGTIIGRGGGRDDLRVLGAADFAMGSDDAEGFAGDGEGPSRRVTLPPFAMAAHAVSNDDFAAFVAATGYRTRAEHDGWSFVFRPSVERAPLTVAGMPWWQRVDGASWRRPQGPGSSLDGLGRHPVVHVSWHDAVAYCHWVGGRLPSEAEWEYAARGGLDGCRYAWGDELHADGRHHCNIWQGTFPRHDSGEDGYVGTAPVDAFAANGFGLYNTCGNTWEWCADWFSPNYHRVTRAHDPFYAVPSGSRSMRGGSFLCHASYCNRYRVAARFSNTPSSATAHTGFRVAADVDEDGAVRAVNTK